MAHILEIKSLNKSFKDFSLTDVNLSLEKGFIMGFIGPNGAGKSTTIKLIMNLMKKDSGEIKVFGLDHIRDEKTIKNRIGFVFDENYFYEELTISEMKRIIAPIYSNWDDHAFGKYLKEFDLPSKKKIKDLSKGMKMKFSLAIALSHHAELLIMDEPTSGLDPLVRSELLDILLEIMQDENKGILFSTHITSDLDKVADYITIINKGRVVLSTEKDSMIDHFGLVKGPKELLDSDIRKEFIAVKENHFGFEGLIADKEKARKIFKESIVIEKPTLEDIMLYFTRGNQHV